MFNPLRKAECAAEALRPLIDRFRRQTVLVFATGPSLPTLWPPEHPLPPYPKIAVSNACERVPDADVCYSTDGKWWGHYNPRFAGLKVGYDACELRDVVVLEGSGAEGFDPRLGYVRHGGNSGYAATHLAAQLEPARIILVGFDMRKVPLGKTKDGRLIEKEHFFGDHPTQIRGQNNYELWAVRFAELARELDKRGIELLNATPGSKLRLPFIDLDNLCSKPEAA